MLRPSLVFGLVLAVISLRSASAITVNSSADEGGPNAAGMASILRDPASPFSLVRGSYSTAINDGANTPSSTRAMGTFANGMTAPGTPLPSLNQNAQGTAIYAGGIDINSGICLCTGLITDDDPIVPVMPPTPPMTPVPTGLGVGVEGPNNGQPLAAVGDPGEVDFELGKPRDADFANVIAPGADGDATVLKFKVVLSKPGLLRISFVHASDEFPRFGLVTYNDTPLVFVGDANGQNLKNFIVFKDSLGMDKTLSLNELRICQLLKGNLVAPSPEALPDPDTPDPTDEEELNHADVGTTLHFNHEFGGFTKKLTRETCDIYAPGVYTIKLVIQDVGDDNLDSATFFEGGSLKLFSFALADFNLDGIVNPADRDIYNFNEAPGVFGKKFTDGDANGDGQVSGPDLSIIIANMWTYGNRNLKYDFNRDGVVNVVDEAIWEDNQPLMSCASRAEGDADADGDVDDLDKPPPTYSNEVVGPCGAPITEYLVAGGGGGGEGGGNDGEIAAGAAWESVPHEVDESEAIAQAAERQAEAGKAADADGDGDFDQNDVAYWKVNVPEMGASAKK